jgi:hypothetical protein
VRDARGKERKQIAAAMGREGTRRSGTLLSDDKLQTTKPTLLGR